MPVLSNEGPPGVGARPALFDKLLGMNEISRRTGRSSK